MNLCNFNKLKKCNKIDNLNYKPQMLKIYYKHNI